MPAVPDEFFLRIFMYLGSISCISLYFFEGDNVEYGIILSVLASIGFTGSLVFYNAFLRHNLRLFLKYDGFGIS